MKASKSALVKPGQMTELHAEANQKLTSVHKKFLNHVYMCAHM